MPIEFDTDTFKKSLIRTVSRVQPALITRGMGRAGLRLLHDAVFEEPSVPMDESSLQASGSVFVNGKMVGDSRSFAVGTVDATPVEAWPFSGKPWFWEVVVVFNKPYAHWVHEGVTFEFQQKKGTEGAKFQQKKGTEGAKFLEAKIMRNGGRYYAIVAESARGGRA